jgi:hypothetical protein
VADTVVERVIDTNKNSAPVPPTMKARASGHTREGFFSAGAEVAGAGGGGCWDSIGLRRRNKRAGEKHVKPVESPVGQVPRRLR